MDSTKKIIHIDMDAFYASVEQRDQPSLKGKAIAVGSNVPRGVILTASYEARKYGIRSAMPSSVAVRKFPELIFVPPRFEAYKEVSKIIRGIFFDYTDLVEPLSLDEAFLDVTANKKDIRSATIIAKEIKSRILKETQLTASAGISINKFLAKIASDLKKPDGLTVIPPNKALSFIENLPIEKFHGIGKVTAQKMKELGICNGLDLKSKSEKELVRQFGKNGKYFYQIVRGIDPRPVDPERPRKSLSVENTFESDLTQRDEINYEASRLAEVLFKRILKSESYGKTLTIKIKYADFKQVTRSITYQNIIDSRSIIETLSYQILEGFDTFEPGIRLLGIGVSNFHGESDQKHQLTLPL